MAEENLQILMYEDILVNFKKEMEVEDHDEERNERNQDFKEGFIVDHLDYAPKYLQKIIHKKGDMNIEKEIDVNEENDDIIRKVSGIQSEPTVSSKSSDEKKIVYEDVKVEDLMVKIKEEMEVNSVKEEEHNGRNHEFEAKIEPVELDYAHNYLQKLILKSDEVNIKEEIEVNEEDEESRMENVTNQDFEMSFKEEMMNFEEPIDNVLEDTFIKSNNASEEQFGSTFFFENEELSLPEKINLIDNSKKMIKTENDPLFYLDPHHNNENSGISEAMEVAKKRSCEEDNSASKRKKTDDIPENKVDHQQLRAFRRKRGRPRKELDYEETIEHNEKRLFGKKRGRPRKIIDSKIVKCVNFKRKRGRPRKILEDGEIGTTKSNKYTPKIDPYSLLSDKEILARNPCPTLKQVKICVARLTPKNFINSIFKEMPRMNTDSVRNICKQLIKMRSIFREKFIRRQKKYMMKNEGVSSKINYTDLVDLESNVDYNDKRKVCEKQDTALLIENGTKDSRDSELKSGNINLNLINQDHPFEITFHKSSSQNQTAQRTTEDLCYSPIIGLDCINNEQSTPNISNKDHFNHETDNLNQISPRSSKERMKLNKSGVVLKHSKPVVALQTPFIPTFMGEKKLRNFHKPTIKRYSHGPLASPGPHQVHSLTEEIKIKAKIRKLWPDVFYMQTPDDLTGKDGDIIMVEYLEENPPLMSQVGMCSVIKNYYNSQPGMDEYPPNYRYGGTCFLQNPPFLASLQPGQSIQTVENNMYRSPIYEHKVPLTDFLIIRSRSGYSIREIDALYTSGQQYPHYEVPTPNSKNAITFSKNFLLVFIYNLFWKSHDTPRKIKMNKIKQAFPAHSESSIRKCLKPIADFKRTGIDSGCWVIKPEVKLPSREEITAMVSPEQCCAFFSSAAAQQKLKDAGYVDNFHLSLDDDMKEDEIQRFEYEIKIAPWHINTPYIQAVRGRDLLQLTGSADSKGKTTEIEKSKISSSKGFYLPEHQEHYKQECQQIFEYQNRVLASSEVLLTDEEELDEDGDSEIEDTMNSAERKVSNNGFPQTASDTEVSKELKSKESNKLQDMENKVPDVTGMFRREDRRVLRISRTYLSSEGKKYTRTELVRNDKVIDAYIKIKTLKDNSFIKIFTEDIDENQKEEMKRERRRIQEKLRRIKRNREREEKGIVHPPRIKKARYKPDLKLTCGACGQVGHMRTNKTCPFYVGFSEFGSEIQMETPTLNESEELVVVDGTKIKLSSKVMKYAEELKKHSEVLESHKKLVLGSHKNKIEKPKRRRAGISDHCDYLKKRERPINRRKVDPLVTLSTIFEEILIELREIPGAEPFIYPVNQKEVPDYYDIITNPMDLLTIRKNLHLKKYQNRKEFLGDISQIVENSKVYNGYDSAMTMASKKLLDVCIECFSKKKDKLIHLEKLINPLLDDEQVAFDFILTQIMNERLLTNKVSWPFMKPVNAKNCKDYYNIIHDPMDLSSIQQKIKSHRYHSRTDFMNDIQLIEINALKYNGIESSFTEKAQALTKLAKASLEEWDSDFEILETAIASGQNRGSLNNSIDPDYTNNNLPETENEQKDKAHHHVLPNATIDNASTTTQDYTSLVKNIPDTKKGIDKLCLVCGDNVIRDYFGLLICRSCKHFWSVKSKKRRSVKCKKRKSVKHKKRSIKSNKIFPCVVDGSCTINKTQRNKCAYCRFQKCLKVGMKLEVSEDSSNDVHKNICHTDNFRNRFLNCSKIDDEPLYFNEVKENTNKKNTETEYDGKEKSRKLPQPKTISHEDYKEEDNLLPEDRIDNSKYNTKTQEIHHNSSQDWSLLVNASFNFRGINEDTNKKNNETEYNEGKGRKLSKPKKIFDKELKDEAELLSKARNNRKIDMNTQHIPQTSFQNFNEPVSKILHFNVVKEIIKKENEMEYNKKEERSKLSQWKTISHKKCQDDFDLFTERIPKDLKCNIKLKKIPHKNNVYVDTECTIAVGKVNAETKTKCKPIKSTAGKKHGKENSFKLENYQTSKSENSEPPIKNRSINNEENSVTQNLSPELSITHTETSIHSQLNSKTEVLDIPRSLTRSYELKDLEAGVELVLRGALTPGKAIALFSIPRRTFYKRLAAARKIRGKV